MAHSNIRQYLQVLSNFKTDKPHVHLSPYQRLLAIGVEYSCLPSPIKVPRGKPKACFENAFWLAMERPEELTYVEGFALAMMPVHHAWVVDSENRVIDPTWKGGSEYLGIPFDRDYLLASVTKSGMYSIMFNHCFPEFVMDDPLKYLPRKVAVNCKSPERCI